MEQNMTKSETSWEVGGNRIQIINQEENIPFGNWRKQVYGSQMEGIDKVYYEELYPHYQRGKPISTISVQMYHTEGLESCFVANRVQGFTWQFSLFPQQNHFNEPPQSISIYFQGNGGFYLVVFLVGVCFRGGYSSILFPFKTFVMMFPSSS